VIPVRVVYCAGEQGRVVLDILRSVGDVDDVVFADDDESRQGERVEGVPVVGGLEALAERAGETDEEEAAPRCLVAFGDRQGVRLSLAERLAEAGFGFFEAIHPDATVSETATLGDGVTVNAGSYLGPGVAVGDHALVDSCVNVSHDAVLGTGATLTPNATLAGGVSVGRGAYVGPGATVLEDRSVGPGAVVGAGAVVTEDVPPDTTVVGVPAEPVEE
jgi:sugar O-acyltransferase (sialic acid O-acetyltransferase NeuD family)